jgi:outer membrane protein OmpU
MKKILLASTALVATAGFAAADVSLGGSAEVGVVGGSGMETQFHTDVDVAFKMTGETDGGLSFGATVDLDEGGSGAAAVANDADDGGASFFVAAGAFRMDAGDTDGAFDAAMSEVALAGGSINDAETGHAGYNGNSGLDGTYDGQIVRFSYSAASFTGHLSVELDDAGVGDPVVGLGVAYNADLAGLSLGVGIGYQEAGSGTDVMGISLKTTFANGLSAAINYSEMTAGGATTDHTAIGFGYSANGLSVGVNYGEYSTGAEGIGLAVAYDLGGGMAVQVGYGDSTSAAGVSSDAWSVGLAMSF